MEVQLSVQTRVKRLIKDSDSLSLPLSPSLPPPPPSLFVVVVVAVVVVFDVSVGFLSFRAPLNMGDKLTEEGKAGQQYYIYIYN